MTIAFDRDLLDEFIMVDPSVETVDDYLEELIDEDFISDEDLMMCKTSATLLDTGDLFLSFRSVRNSDSYCAMLAAMLVDTINAEIVPGSASPAVQYM